MAQGNPEDDLDVDEDGNPTRATRRESDGAAVPPVGQPDSQPAVAANAAALAARPVGGPLLKPQPTSGTNLAILAQHFDMPQEFATFLRQFDSSFLDRDYLYAVDVNAYWKVKYGLDHLVDLIAGQVDTHPILRVAMPGFLREYHGIDEAAEDWEDEIHQKVFMLSKLVKVAGLGTKDAAKPKAVVLPEAMQLRIRAALEPWQMKPDEAGVVQVAEAVAQAIVKRRLMLMVVDVDPFAGIAFGGGKSQLLWQIGYWTFEVLGKTFDGRKDIVYRQDRARMTRLMGESDNVPVLVDEINQFFDMWNWNEPANKYLVHQVEMYRKVGRPIIGACSQIWILNKRFREVIVTHRLSVTKWDDDNFTGEATLFEKWGPPAAQDEKENKWGREVFRIKFAGLTPKQFQFYSACADKTRDIEEDQSLDDYLTDHQDWLADVAEGDAQITLRVDVKK